MSDFILYLPQLLSGLSISIILMMISLSCGLLLAISMAIVDYTAGKMIKKILAAWVFFICGTPLLVQIFLIYFGSGQFDLIRNSYLWIFLQSPMICAILALSINTSCYTFVLIQSAIRSIPHSEIEACAAIGMSKFLALRKIILPRALRIFLPAYSNEIIIVLKSTSLVSTITILDLMGVTQELISQTYATIEFYVIAAIIYLTLAGGLSLIFKKLQKFSQIDLV